MIAKVYKESFNSLKHKLIKFMALKMSLSERDRHVQTELCLQESECSLTGGHSLHSTQHRLTEELEQIQNPG